MPISVIAGAQYGSEGKGKVAHAWAKRSEDVIAVRVGGPNSGHTVVDDEGRHVFRQLPTAALEQTTLSVVPPGAYLREHVILDEIRSLNLDSSRLLIDPRAVVITDADVEAENSAQLSARIGSTGSGTGAAVGRRIRRDGTLVRAENLESLREYLGDTLPLLHEALRDQRRVLIEGTQGYGLSIMHGLERDFATSRDTTAAAFVSEAGLSPLDVDEVVLVARAFPIRVAGNSGELANETSWSELSERSGRHLEERTTVTKRVRRVGEFEPEIVRRAIYANSPTHLVLNHVDYVADLSSQEGVDGARQFVSHVEAALDRKIDLVGVSERKFVGSDLRELHRV